MKKIINNKLLSILVITIIYVLTTIIGIIIYNKLPYSNIINIFIVDIICTIIVYIFSVIFKNASIYDPYWSVQPIIILTLYSLTKTINIPIIIMLISIYIWGIRLTLNWAYTFKNLTHQDWRYTMLKEKNKKIYELVNLFGIHLMPTILVFLAILPALYIIDYSTSLTIYSIFGLIVCLIATSLELVSDYQMHKFRSKSKGLINTGLWKYSRHPNYLGEILMWWGILIQAIPVFNSFLLIGPLAITLLFLFISIPMADKRQSKKEGYQEYKKRTNRLIPIKRRIYENK